MQAPQNLVNLRLIMGKNTNSNDLAKAHFRFASGPQQTKKLKQEINFPIQLGQDLNFQFIFEVDKGRQKQCINYIQAGMIANKQQNTENLSPIQALFERPTHQGTVQLQSFPGKVIVTYKFPSENIQSLQPGFKQWQQISSSLSMNMDLKGQVAHNNNNRTAVKIDYTAVTIQSNKILPQQFVSLVSQIQPQIGTNPMFKMIGKAKKVNMELQTNSFRKIKAFFEKAKAGDKDVQSVTKDFPYTAPGILKSKAQFALFYKDWFGVNGKTEYHSEQVFLRLIKVYTIFFTKGVSF